MSDRCFDFMERETEVLFTIPRNLDPESVTETLIPAPHCHQGQCGVTWSWLSTVVISGEGRVGPGVSFPLTPKLWLTGIWTQGPHSFITTGCVPMKFPVPGGNEGGGSSSGYHLTHKQAGRYLPALTDLEDVNELNSKLLFYSRMKFHHIHNSYFISDICC